MTATSQTNAFPLAERAEAAAEALEVLLTALRVEDPSAWSTAALTAGGFETIARFILSLARAEPPGEPRPAPSNIPLKRDDAQVRMDFCLWAKSNGFDLAEHPLHALFLDRQTQLSWQAWKDATEVAQWPLGDAPR